MRRREGPSVRMPYFVIFQKYTTTDLPFPPTFLRGYTSFCTIHVILCRLDRPCRRSKKRITQTRYIISEILSYDYREKYRGDRNVSHLKRRNTSRFTALLFIIMILVMAVCLLAGCVTRPQKTRKLRDLEFTVLDKDDVPEEFAIVIEENKAMPFKLTFADRGYLYIAEGYGAQPTTGYSVEVNGLYETENAVYIHTNLLGPAAGEETKEISTFPYVAVKLEYIEKTVLFD